MSARLLNLVLFIAAILLAIQPAAAVPPSPEAKAKFIQEGTWDRVVANLKAHEAALPAGWYEEGKALHRAKYRAATALGADAVDTLRVCVLLVEFSDFKHDYAEYHIPSGGVQPCYTVGTPQRFDSLLFSERGKDPIYNSTGSMTEFYLENSYGTYYIQGDVFGWFGVPNTYDFYVSVDDGISRGSLLAHDAVMAADDAGVDFLPYASASSVPGIVVIHAGPGAEEGAYGIWSHSGNTSVSVDGVWLSRYAMQPEETVGSNALSSVGVFCHEWGHVLGAMDLYDVTYTPGSEGLGAWSLMASGSWNSGGQRPSHFDAYSKFDLGFNSLQVLEQNVTHATIPQAETSPVAYLLKENPVQGEPNSAMWFVENRQRTGFDDALPGSGLLIYHMDPLGHQTDTSRYYLAVEEADGRRDLVKNWSLGQDSDPFPGTTNNRNFHDYSVPNARTNDGAVTEVSVLNISDSDSLMYADLGVYYAMPWLFLAGDSLDVTDPAPGGNGDGIFDQGETLDITLEVRNVMKQAFWPTLHLDLNNPGLEILANDKNMGTALNPETVNNYNYEPIRVRIPSEFISSKVKFTFTVISDSLITLPHDRAFSSSFEFVMQVGTRAQILLVDDDNGDAADYAYRSRLDSLDLLYTRWDKYSQGSPVYQDLSQYPFVLWMTGPYYPGTIPPITGGILTADDVTFMKQLLDNGGNLLLGSVTAPVQLQTLDSAFMANYLHAQLTGSVSQRSFVGDSDNVVGGGLMYTTRNEVIWNQVTPTIEPVNSGQAVFTLRKVGGTTDLGHCGIIYDGAYRTVFLSFPVEFLQDRQLFPGYSPMDSLINRALIFFVRGAATDVDDQPTDNLLPRGFALDQNYPNPFNPSTTIIYQIGPGRADRTSLEVFNVLGQRVATLVDQTQGPGNYTVTWQGVDDRGGRVASGVYFYRLIHGNDADTKKMLLLK